MDLQYRVSKQTLSNGDIVFAIREFYPNNEGELTSWTEDETKPVAGSIDDLRWMLNKMIESLDKGIIEISHD